MTNDAKIRLLRFRIHDALTRKDKAAKRVFRLGLLFLFTIFALFSYCCSLLSKFLKRLKSA